jgi:hypothetical protein
MSMVALIWEVKIQDRNLLRCGVFEQRPHHGKEFETGKIRNSIEHRGETAQLTKRPYGKKAFWPRSCQECCVKKIHTVSHNFTQTPILFYFDHRPNILFHTQQQS